MQWNGSAISFINFDRRGIDDKRLSQEKLWGKVWTGQVHLYHWRSSIFVRERHHFSIAGIAVEIPRTAGDNPEVRPIPERGPRHNVSVPARRSVRN